MPGAQDHNDIATESYRVNSMRHHPFHISTESRLSLWFEIDTVDDDKRNDNRRGKMHEKTEKKFVLPKEPKRRQSGTDVSSEFEWMNLLIQDFL